jgi:hypothetical protein
MTTGLECVDEFPGFVQKSNGSVLNNELPAELRNDGHDNNRRDTEEQNVLD